MSPTLDLDALLTATDQASPTRQCFLLRVRPDKLAEYVDVHQRVWQEMRDALTDAGWRNYSLFLDRDSGTVVGYFESDDADAAQRAMAATEVNTRWQADMAQYFDGEAGGQARILPQYFYLP
ncbi:L-rhamnose mutarotase [Actinomyces sp. B33]|uniref:L-rhamnose mutarotase n=1 Tax=Actinomyces sp. B33 TaxID=2942131 RepID=UPI002340A2EF|nr:L-rhamnose mutarotase [Actinomyces sp. B33]MDC4233421.1 L-rhamnose mutarotase [Actinomyces sp. B33]